MCRKKGLAAIMRPPPETSQASSARVAGSSTALGALHILVTCRPSRDMSSCGWVVRSELVTTWASLAVSNRYSCFWHGEVHEVRTKPGHNTRTERHGEQSSYWGAWWNGRHDGLKMGLEQGKRRGQVVAGERSRSSKLVGSRASVSPRKANAPEF